MTQDSEQYDTPSLQRTITVPVVDPNLDGVVRLNQGVALPGLGSVPIIGARVRARGLRVLPPGNVCWMKEQSQLGKIKPKLGHTWVGGDTGAGKVLEATDLLEWWMQEEARRQGRRSEKAF